MNKKKLTISVCLFFILATAILSGVYFTKKDNIAIKLNGEKEMVIELGEEYIEKGCEFYVGDIKLDNIKTNGSVDINTPGVYKITYSADYLTRSAKAIRTVRVKDTCPPVITAPEELELTVGINIKDADFQYSSFDNYDGDITNRMTVEYKTDKIVLCSSDSSGNKSTAEIKIQFVKDTEFPIITLSGPSNIFLMAYSEYTDPGFSASDNIDGDITHKVKISGTDELDYTGNHTIVYSVTDTSGNTTEKHRNVYVYDPDKFDYTPSDTSKVIYLTFDDGPCIYTPEILNILSKYNVTATFFVTNQKPNCQSYIADAYKAGHAIGAHTYSHLYSIYQSSETYFSDLEAINEIIKQQTGSYTRLIRFPGGSSNTISKKYCKGIMSQLTSEVTDRGYVYFDWNVVSGDADSSSKKNDPNYMISNVTEGLKQGANVVLMHDINPANITALPSIIEYGLSNGYIFLPLSENSPTAHHPVLN